jgi:hypothetical protein
VFARGQKRLPGQPPLSLSMIPPRPRSRPAQASLSPATARALPRARAPRRTRRARPQLRRRPMLLRATTLRARSPRQRRPAVRRRHAVGVVNWPRRRRRRLPFPSAIAVGLREARPAGRRLHLRSPPRVTERPLSASLLAYADLPPRLPHLVTGRSSPRPRLQAGRALLLSPRWPRSHPPRRQGSARYRHRAVGRGTTGAPIAASPRPWRVSMRPGYLLRSFMAPQ